MLADQLITEAEAEPSIGGSALVSLAISVAGRRSADSAAETEENGAEPASQLSILRVALRTAQAGPANRVRLQLAVSVADQAYHEGDIELARNAIDQAMSRELKRRGFSFVGPTICYAFMQATGMVNDHVVSCFRYDEV